MSSTSYVQIHLLFLTTCAIVIPSSSPGAPSGKITIQAEEVQDSKFILNFELSATKLEKKDFFGKVCQNNKTMKRGVGGGGWEKGEGGEIM